MRLIECDRCKAREDIGEFWNQPATPKDWLNFTITSARGSFVSQGVLCPACVERALEKPELCGECDILRGKHFGTDHIWVERAVLDSEHGSSSQAD